jgi:ATP-dependent helicase/nuclease subunit B
LLDLLKSPFVFAGLAEKPGLVLAIELALRRANVSGGWEEAATALAGQTTAWRTLAGIARQAGLFAGRKTPSEWLVLTDAAFAELDMRAALEADAAGMQVIATLAAIAEECGPMEQTFSFAEWRAFVSLQLEATPFVPPNSDQRVVMLPLNGARLRCFDAVLMVGADAQHLPSRPNEALFFANAVRRELGLATRESRQCQQMRDFAELISASRPIVLSWQAQRDGDPNPVSSWILRLQLALERNGATMLPEHRLPVTLEQLLPALPTPPRPVAPHLLPRQLSASAYNVFVACPYQFFATRMLGLSGLDELTDMPEKRDYGDWLHQILAQYHEAVRAQDTAIEERAQVLREISEKVFGAALAGNAAVLAYYTRWLKAMPAYLHWANEREADGWRFVAGERWFERTLQWGDGEITLRGRVDRIDENDAGERAVLDYKTKNVSALRKKLKENEDYQLAFYGLLSDTPVSAAHYVALEPERGKTGDAAADQYAEWQQALADHITASMRAVAGGAPLPASGIELVCRFCDVRGLCRKGGW